MYPEQNFTDVTINKRKENADDLFSVPVSRDWWAMNQPLLRA